jgi:hypothetical protein
LADEAADLPDIIDEAGMFLIQEKEYEDGFALYRSAVERFPDSPALYVPAAHVAPGTWNGSTRRSKPPSERLTWIQQIHRS